MAVSVVFFLFSWCSTGGPEAHSAGWWFSLLHLISNLSGPQLIRAPRPLWPDVAFLTTSRLISNWNSNCLISVLTELYNSSTPTQSPTWFLESHVGSSSSGNNCHAVHRSLSSGASVYECTMGIFFTLSHFVSQFPPTRFPLITAIRMCHFPPVHHLGMAFLAGLKVKIQHKRPHGVMVIIIGNGHSELSSDSGQGCMHFAYPCERYASYYFPFYGFIAGQTDNFSLDITTSIGEEKL